MQRRHFLTLCGGGLAALSLASPGQARRQLGLMSDARPVVTEHPLLHKLEWWFLMHPGMRGGTRLVDITGKYVGTATNMAAVATSTSGLSQVTTRRGGDGRVARGWHE